MTRNRAGAGNVITALSALYYAQRASAGLIVSEASQISPLGIGYPNTPGIHTDEQVEGWRFITERVPAAGGRIVLQLWHAGRVSHASLLPDGVLPIAPSPIAAVGKAFTKNGLQPFPTPRELTTSEIRSLVEDFAAAAQRAQAAEFDGVELHGASGYLIDQFLRDGSNHRTDAYGGSIRNRVRFLLEIAEAVAATWGASRIGVRISPTQSFNDMHDSDPAGTFQYAAKELNALGLAYLHVVEPVVDAGDTPEQRIAPLLRRAFAGAFILNGGYTQSLANSAIAAGEADLISFGSAFIANPDLPERIRRGAPLNTPDRSTYYGGDHRGYTDYPTFSDVQVT